MAATKWNWERHLTEAENKILSALFEEGSGLRERLEQIREHEDCIFRTARDRAKAAADKKPSFKLKASRPVSAGPRPR